MRPQRGIVWDHTYAQYDAVEAMRKSELTRFAEVSPAQYHRDKDRPKDTTAAMYIGDAVDRLLFEGDDALRRRYFRLDGRAGTIDYKAAVFRAGDLVPLSSADWERVHDMARAVRRSKHARELMDGARYQASLYWRDPATGLWLKARPDVVPAAPPRLADLKVTHDNTDLGFYRVGRKYLYGWQAAIYCAGMTEITGEAWDEFSFITVRDQPIHHVEVFDLDRREVFDYWDKVAEQIDLYAKCVERNNWPSGPGRSPISFRRRP